jgi:hypothetical protein
MLEVFENVVYVRGNRFGGFAYRIPGLCISQKYPPETG